jgi:hypothetical protein
MRKWYGETEKLTMPGERPPEDENEGHDDDPPRDAVLVTGADSQIGELIVLQLVLARYAAESNAKQRIDDTVALQHIAPISRLIGGGATHESLWILM